MHMYKIYIRRHSRKASWGFALVRRSCGAVWARVAVACTANAHMRVGHDIIFSMATDWNVRLPLSCGLVCVNVLCNMSQHDH